MQYSQEHLKTMVYAKFVGQTECIMGNWKIENSWGYGVLSILRLHAQLDRFCVLMNNVTVLKARLRKTLGQKFSPKQSHSVIP